MREELLVHRPLLGGDRAQGDRSPLRLAAELLPGGDDLSRGRRAVAGQARHGRRGVTVLHHPANKGGSIGGGGQQRDEGGKGGVPGDRQDLVTHRLRYLAPEPCVGIQEGEGGHQVGGPAMPPCSNHWTRPCMARARWVMKSLWRVSMGAARGCAYPNAPPTGGL